MTTDNSSNATTQGATPRVGDMLLGGMVFFKALEETHDAINVEGRSKGYPLILEGYKARDFGALIKVLYPTSKDMVTGAYTLTKDEWIGVLNLSTRWQMDMMREFAIAKLSNLSLSPVEKVTLARDHKVAKWLQEGLNEILTQEDTLEPVELKSHLGLETAFRLVWIQNQSFKRPQISMDDPEAMYVHLMSVQNLRCKHCSNQPLPNGTYICPSSCGTDSASLKFIAPASRQSANTDTVNIEEVFKEEIASYESWNQ
ncbi:hypothetical protein EST38_g14054 [Candolleomyces aberdarensis]|uniref:BTB domain-containing protein n=1 Tax=Candolleomyces aberdarensis TaxID=2316362 RepID=A0A4Q2D0N6_9AGAR|nr:hypothetical protein EST38_g14054 [Candolleomyces aberdarensis]